MSLNLTADPLLVKGGIRLTMARQPRSSSGGRRQVLNHSAREALAKWRSWTKPVAIAVDEERTANRVRLDELTR